MKRLVRDPETEPGYREMQKNCVAREGREEEYEDTLHEVGLHHPEWSRSKRIHETYQLMGLTHGVALQRHRDMMAVSDGDEAEVREEKVQEELSVEERRREFESVFQDLPLEADRLSVLAWIENHPAMILPRPANEDGLVTLTAEDISDAPSRSAVGELQHWVNQKDKFYSELMKRKPKELEEESEGLTVDDLETHDPTLKDVKKMLDSIGC